MSKSAMTVSGLTSGSGAPLATPVTVANGGTGTSTLTSHGVLLGAGTSPVTAQALTDGQLVIGHTGAAPTAATITAGANITVTNGTGSITIAAAGTTTPAWTLITSTSISGTNASYAFTDATIVNYNNIYLVLESVIVSANTSLYLGASNNGGAAYNVITGISNASGSYTLAAPMLLGPAGSMILTVPHHGWISIANSNITELRPTSQFISSAGQSYDGGGYFYISTQLNAFQLSVGTGHFVSGTINLYGV